MKPGETLDARGRAARPRGDEPGDARGLPRPADRPRPAARVPDPLPARLRRADRLRRVPAALPRQAPRAHARRGRRACETNVKAALERLRRFQASDGGFGYWPGDDDSADWATNYAGHFAVEAQKAGYLPPPGLLDQWTAFQRRRARAWVAGEGQAELTQAYRLFTLALAGAPELPAMNQLRERASLPVTAKWRLAAAYQLAGQPEAARALATRGPVTIQPYRELAFTYGSDLRDRAMVLEAVVLLDLAEHVGPSRQGPVGVALEEPVAEHAGDGVRAPRPLEGGDRPEGRGEDGLLLRVDGRRRRPRSRPPRPSSRGGSRSARARRGSSCATPAPRRSTRGSSCPALPAVGRETAAANGLSLEVQYLTPGRQAARPVPPRAGDGLQGGGEGDEHGRAGRLPERGPLARGRLGLGDPQRPARPEPRRARPRPSSTRTCATTGSTPTSTSGRARRRRSRWRSTRATSAASTLPMVTAEAMYDATLNARAKGQWVEVVEPGQ